jgi:predicted RNA binding protein YcfA (HicA-like mRNA interferase family)
VRSISPPVSGLELVDALERHGFVVVATVGAHSALRGRSSGQAVVVPLHDELSHGTLAAVLQKAGFELDQLPDLPDPPDPRP